MTSITVTDLLLERPGFRLGPIDFAVEAGGRFAIVGASGSGKTTLLRCLCGLERPQRGTIRVGDAVVFDAARRIDLPPDRRGLGLVFQDGALWPHMTALQHLTFAAPAMTRSWAMALLERGGLGPLAEKKPPQMSGGEAQRLGLLRALAPSPRALLLDEPLRSVDVHRRDELVLLLRSLADERELTTVLVTHDRDEALALATDLVVLHQGRLVEAGPADELLQRPRTAFTAAFLAGAACLPTTAGHNGSVETAFGPVARPAGGGELRLVLLPGEATADPDRTEGGPRGTVLSCLPDVAENGTHGCRVRVALGDQIVTAHSLRPIAPGRPVTLILNAPPRLLPWQPETVA